MNNNNGIYTNTFIRPVYGTQTYVLSIVKVWAAG